MDHSRHRSLPWPRLLRGSPWLDILILLRAGVMKARQVLNFDEVPLSHSYGKQKGPKRRVAAVDYDGLDRHAERGEQHVTGFLGVSPSGHTTKPLMIIPRQKQPSAVEATEATYGLGHLAAQTSGSMTKELLLEWLPRLVEEYRRDAVLEPTDHMVVVVDGHRSRYAGELITSCEEHCITLLLLPSHSSHLLQPVDRGVGNRARHTADRAEPTGPFVNWKAVLKSQLGGLLRVRDPNAAVTSWAATGLFPFDLGRTNHRKEVPADLRQLFDGCMDAYNGANLTRLRKYLQGRLEDPNAPLPGDLIAKRMLGGRVLTDHPELQELMASDACPKWLKPSAAPAAAAAPRPAQVVTQRRTYKCRTCREHGVDAVLRGHDCPYHDPPPSTSSDEE